MIKYPNRTALYEAHNIYRDAMRDFVMQRLKRVQGTTPKEIIRRVLTPEQIDDLKASIDINDFPRIIRDHSCWVNTFSQLFGSQGAMDIRGMTSVIGDGRKFWAHPGAEDVDPEAARTHLSLVADVLGGINKPDAKKAVETIRDQLFSDEVEEHPVEVENAALKENFADITKQLEAAKAEKTELEKQVKTTSDRLKEVEAEWIACDERLETVSTQLNGAVAEKNVAEERLSDISNRFEEAEVENAELKKCLSETENRLRTVEEKLAELKEPLPQNPNIPDFVIFQSTTFIKHLDKYSVAGDAITQSFWNYWRSLGSEGKEEMRDAGWSVEKVDDDYWEITVSPEDFEAWVEEDDEPLGPSTQPSYERTSLPTVKEMVEPALELFVDKKEHRRVEMINLLTEHFSLDDDERRDISRTGQVEKHLMKEGLIERTRTGYYRITSRGLEVLGKNSSRGRNNKTDRTREAPDGYTKRTRVKRINLPTGKEMEQPALEFLRDGREYPRIEIIDMLTDHFSLTKDQREVLSRSGRVELYLRNNGLIERTRTGYYRITDLGFEILK